MSGPVARGRLGAACGATAAVGLVLGLGPVAFTDAAWTDPVLVEASANVGRWTSTTTLGSCEVLDVGDAQVPGTACTVVSTRLVEQGGIGAGNLFRQYEVTFTTTSTPTADERIRFRADLSSPEVTSTLPEPNPDWSWADASTSPNGSYATVPGYACASLPLVDGDVTAGSAGPILISVRDHPTADRTCVP